MKKSIKKVSIIIMFLLVGLFLYPNIVSAEEYSSEFIKVTDSSSKVYINEELSISEVYFNKNINYFGELKSYGTLHGRMVNLSDYYLTVYMTIDYYDANYNIIARSTKTEKPSSNTENYMMNIILYENDFLGEASINDIAYFKIKYYIIKGNRLPNSNNNNNNSNNNGTLDSSTKPSQNGYYSNKDYVIDSYNIDIAVNENNTYDITETIEAYFNTSKHGIYRTIPLKNTITRLDGTTNKNRAQISNVKVNDNYTTSKENDNYKIKIGSASVTLTGKKQYEISYNYNIGKDRSNDYDELYFNIIGDEWDTVIGNITFTITMPKSFDASKLGFSSGNVGSTDSSKITYNVNENVITGSYNGIINPGEALTVRMELPDGYFVNAGYQVSLSIYLFFIIPIACLIITIFLWYKFGKDEKVIETVEFYPPEGFNSLEIGYLYKGEATSEDVTSLLVYLANKGYIKIREKEQKSFFSNTNNFEIIKLKEYDGDNDNEREFIKGLFKDCSFIKVSNVANYEQKIETMVDEKVPVVTQSDLYNSFYKTMDKILENINSKKNKKKVFESVGSSKSKFIILMIIISLLSSIVIPSLEYASLEEAGLALFIVLFYVPFYAVGLSKDTPTLFRIFWLGFTILHSFVFFCTMPVMTAIREEKIFLIGFLLGVACIIGMIVCLKAMSKRTKYGNEILGKIKGFKTFLETAEKDKLEAMVMQYPTYFYDILPFTYVLGISNKWIKKFESINLQEPDWYYSSSGFNVSSFRTFMNSTMTSAQSAMSSSPSSSSGGYSGGGSSGGGSSGGGSSGGGSGGGGGGSW